MPIHHCPCPEICEGCEHWIEILAESSSGALRGTVKVCRYLPAALYLRLDFEYCNDVRWQDIRGCKLFDEFNKSETKKEKK